MLLKLLDTNQSAYIFRQQLLLSLIILTIAIGLILFFLFRIKRTKPAVNRPYRSAYTNVFFIIIVVIVYLFFFFPLLKNTLSLQHRGIETVGRTIRWVDLGEGQRNIEYDFEVDGITFVKQAEIIYGGKEIKGIVCPGGRYVVIYDGTNPENSVIDLKRAIHQSNGQQ